MGKDRLFSGFGRFEAQTSLYKIPRCPNCQAPNPRALPACPSCDLPAPITTDFQNVAAVASGLIPWHAKLLLGIGAVLGSIHKFLTRRWS